jgi:hypothetical protein
MKISEIEMSSYFTAKKRFIRRIQRSRCSKLTFLPDGRAMLLRGWVRHGDRYVVSLKNTNTKLTPEIRKHLIDHDLHHNTFLPSGSAGSNQSVLSTNNIIYDEE